jgi:large subunit ribosomal protein L21
VYAIVQSGGRQVKMAPGEVHNVDRIAVAPGTEVQFERVLLVEKDGGEVLAGAPFVANARVLAVVDGEARGPKLRVFMKKRRKTARWTRGHRTTFTRVRVTEILV